jgi:hypothetical protein
MKDISEDIKMVGDIIMRALKHYSIKHDTKDLAHFNTIIDEFWSDYFDGNQLYEKSTVDN